MGKIYKIFFISLICLQAYAIDFGMEMVYGRYSPSKDLNESRVSYIGIRNNFYLTESFAFQIKYDLTNKLSETNLNRYMFGLRYQVTDIDRDFQPFFDFAYGKESGNSDNNFLQFSLGSKYFVTDKFNILGEANFVKIKDISVSHSFGLGLGYDFYRKPTTGRYTDKPVDEEVLKSLARQKHVDIKEDIFLTPY